MRQLLEALKYLRILLILHRNISLNHIYLDANMQVKLADFNFAVIQEENGYRRNSNVGQIEFRCPESFKPVGYSYNQDEWSFGVIMYKLIFGVFPFKGFNELNFKDLIIEANLVFSNQIKISSQAQDLITQLLHPK